MCIPTNDADLKMKAAMIRQRIRELQITNPRIYEAACVVLSEIASFCEAAAEHLEGGGKTQDNRVPPVDYVLMYRWDADEQWRMGESRYRYPELPLRERGYECRWFKAL